MSPGLRAGPPPHGVNLTDWHWLFGDQLGPHFLAPEEGGPARDSKVVVIEARSVFRRRRFHRAKAHLVLSAMRHRAAELGDRVRYVRADTYRDGLYEAVGDSPVTVHHPTSRAALGLVQSLENVRLLPARGFLVPQDAFRAWADEHGGGRLRQEDFYRWTRRSLGLLMDGDNPAGGRWNHDQANRERPPRGAQTLSAPGPTGPARTTSTPRCAPTWTAGSARTASVSSAVTDPDSFPPPGGRRSRHSAGSSTTGSPGSAPTRTPCSPPTR